MDKSTLISTLEKKGFAVLEDSGVVLVRCNKGEIRQVVTEVEKVVEETGYVGSFGVRETVQETPPH